MKYFRRLQHLFCAVLFLCPISVFAANSVETVMQVTSERSLTTPVDLVITATASALTATIDIVHEDAAIIFENIKPSEVISNYASRITIKGARWVLDNNVTVSIYRHGAIVLPRGKSFQPLTVYTEVNYAGESNGDYNLNTQYRSLGGFNNAIRSFKLKRGFMVTMATSSNGTGYSRVFIANHEDLEIPVLQKELAGKVSFFRVFRWNWPNKKGYSGGNDTDNNLLNTTWFYNWSANQDYQVNREYSPQRHHESGKSSTGNTSHGAWPSWGEINAHNENYTHVLGQNEPDNTGSENEVYTTVDELVELQSPFLTSGMRIGTFAPCNPSNWIIDFVAKTKARNLRVDFVVVHWYKGGQSAASFINDLRWMYEQTGLPVWITEWNNGANWTTEGGFTANGSWQSWTGDLESDRVKNALWMSDVLKALDEAPFVERYAIYNAVQEKRYVVDNHVLTAAGRVYADAKPGFAYTGQYDAGMTWVHSAPSELVSSYASGSQAVTLTWTNPNGEQTDSVVVERRFDGGDYEVVEFYNSSETTSYSYRDILKELPNGVYEYRVTNMDSDGRSRVTNVVAVTKVGAEGDESFQYGSMTLLNTDYTYVTFQQGDNAENPLVIVSPPTFNNTDLAFGPVEHIRSITKGQFSFRYSPWTLSSSQSLTSAESSNYMVVPAGNYSYGELSMEVASAGRVGSDEVVVKFNIPFAEGVTPVVLANVVSSMTTYPFMVKVWDVTAEGFKVKLMREEGLTYGGFPSQAVNYMAVTPGRATMGNGKLLTVGHSATKIGGRVRQRISLLNDESESYDFSSGLMLFAQLQTYHVDAAHVLRVAQPTESDGTWSAFMLRHLESSTTVTTNSASANGDYVGWLAISDDPTAVGGVLDDGSVFDISVVGGRITVNSPLPYAVYTISGQRVPESAFVRTGVYLVRSGKKTRKVYVK